jgi:hypothetical protein
VVFYVDNVLPDGIGPHEGRELELMLRSEKPAALFCDTIPGTPGIIPEAEFQPYVDQGRLLKKEAVYFSEKLNASLRYLYYALPAEAWRIDVFDQMKSDFYIKDCPWTDDMDRKIGQLLGYSDEEIEIFILHQHQFKKTN